MPVEKLTRVTLTLPPGCALKTSAARPGLRGRSGLLSGFWDDFLESTASSSTGAQQIQIDVPQVALTAMREVARKLLEDLT